MTLEKVRERLGDCHRCSLHETRTTLVFGFQAVDRLSKARIEAKTTRTEEKLDAFFGAVRDYVLIGRGWAEAGLLDPADHEALNRIFVPIIERSPYLSSMMVADSRGAGTMLLRNPLEPHLWMNRVTQPDVWGTKALIRPQLCRITCQPQAWIASKIVR